MSLATKTIALQPGSAGSLPTAIWIVNWRHHQRPKHTKKGNWVDEGMRDLKFGAAVEKVVEAVRSLRTIYAPQPGRLSDTQNKAIAGCS